MTLCKIAIKYVGPVVIYKITDPHNYLLMCKIAIKYVGPVVIYKITDPHNYLLMTLDGKILKGLFECEILKPTNMQMSQGNVQNLAQLKQVMNAGLKFNQDR